MTKRRPLTEEKWLSSDSSYDLLGYLQQHCLISRAPGGRRRLRLFAAACCRVVWEHLDEVSRHAVEASERFADGAARKVELAAAHAPVAREHREATDEMRGASHGAAANRPGLEVQLRYRIAGLVEWATAPALRIRSLEIVPLALHGIRDFLKLDLSAPPKTAAVQKQEESFPADIIRCIFGNPFRPLAVDCTRLAAKGTTVAGLARAIYDEHAFQRMPILADALMEAGCGEQAILDHCRAATPHARGCRVLDLVLGTA